MQLVTGIFLTMNYKPSAADAFASVEYIMRDVEWGWLIRYLHSTGASAFFIVVYLHMFRGLLYGSYKKPRELVWILGMFIYLCLMAEAFFGYLLPWGNMSYWGAQVIVSLFGAIPFVGNELTEWISGDFYISDITLNRFFAFHVIAACRLRSSVSWSWHIMALHEVGLEQPDGIEIKEHKNKDGKPIDGVAFHPYHTSKDLVIVNVSSSCSSAVVVFRARHGRIFPRARQLPARRPVADAAAHRPGVVLHAVLRDVARRAGQAARRGVHGLRRAAAVLPALARPLPSEVDSLSRLDVQGVADGVRGDLPHARLPGPPAADPAGGGALPDLHDSVFRVLLLDAVLLARGEDQAGSDQGDAVRAALVALLLSAALAGAGVAQEEANLESAQNNIADTASLQRGAKYFVNYCLGCHSAKYVRYNRLAKDLQLTDQQLIDNLMFTGERPFDTMAIAARPEDQARWFAKQPPDLSLIARSRGTDYLYTFLRSFYADPSRPTGVNNIVLPGTAMPHVLWELQGVQRAKFEQGEGGVEEFKGFESIRSGALPPEEYNEVVRDIVNFLDYIGEPVQRDRQALGIRVIAFLLVFWLIAYLLKKEIWKDVH
jgi:ubiquinol-cytochrome c reductase cytochrome b subunit